MLGLLRVGFEGRRGGKKLTFLSKREAGGGEADFSLVRKSVVFGVFV